MSDATLFTKSAVAPTKTDEDADPTWETWKRGLNAKSLRTTRDRFTIVKAKNLVEYSRTKSVWWRVAVVVLSPIPGLVASLAAPFVPLQDPALGVLKNDQFYIHFMVTLVLTIFGAMIQARAATRLTHSEYTTFDIVCVAVVTSLHLLAFMTLLGYYWRYPVPFSWVITSLPWMMCLVWGHIVVLRGRLRSQRLRNRLLFYLPSLGVQVSQIVAYPVYSAIFAAVGQRWQIVLIALFPVLKFSLKKNIFMMSHHLGDFAREIAVCSVEISASMYQSMIMQDTPSVLATVMVIGVDVALGLVEMKRFMDHDCIVPQDEIVHAAFQLIQGNKDTIHESDLDKYGTKRTTMLHSLRKRLIGRGRTTQVSATVASGSPEKEVAYTVKTEIDTLGKEKLVITHALEILQSAETMLLIEYIEVAIPIVNTVYLYYAAHRKSAIYNPTLAPFYADREQLHIAMESILLYTSLQLVTLVVMIAIIRVRFKLSALSLLAFALESQVWSMQGKLIAWLPVILAFSVVHYGVDFTFQFDFSSPQAP